MGAVALPAPGTGPDGGRYKQSPVNVNGMYVRQSIFPNEMMLYSGCTTLSARHYGSLVLKPLMCIDLRFQHPHCIDGA
jgi:hypothetical protein